MHTIRITVRNYIAKAEKKVYVCGNSKYNIEFDFDAEWEPFSKKTARFSYNGRHDDVIFTGNTCNIPKILNTDEIRVGVYAGDLLTTTPATIITSESILCDGGVPADPPDDIYNQIMEQLNKIGTPNPEAIAVVVADYIAANPIEEKDPTVPAWAKTKKKPEYSADEVGAIAKTELHTAINTALAQAKESGEFDGKTAYQYAQDGGYTKTEVEFAEKLAKEIPEALPNPNALTFTGAINATYDGSTAISVEIPSGGGTDISLGLTSAAVGQIIKVKAVDESGKPTAWEAANMAGGESSFPKFEKLLTHTITEEEIAANPAAFMWNTTQIPNLNDFNVFTLTIRNPDNTTKITFTKWVCLKINNVLMGAICGTSQGARYSYSISANRLYGVWVSENIYNPTNSTGTVLAPPHSNTTFDSNLAASEAVTSIGFTSYGGDYGLTAGIIVEIWGAK